MTEACRKEPFSRRRARPAPLSPHANAYTRVSAAFTMATIASANVAPQVSAPACSPGPLRTPRDLERDNWNPSQRKAASRRSAPRRNPPLTSSVLPHAPQRAALRATKAIAPSRAAFVAKPQVRPGSRDPTEPNLRTCIHRFLNGPPTLERPPVATLTQRPDRSIYSAPSAASTSRLAPPSTSRTTSSTSSRSAPSTPTRASPTGRRLAASSPTTGTTCSTFAATMSSM